MRENGIRKSAALRRAAALVFLWTAFLAFAPERAAAHALTGEREPGKQSVVLKFAYSTGDPAAYAAVEVYGPASRDIEFQNGRTDQTGRFAFTPNAPGAWRIIVADTMGHKTEIPVAVEAGADGSRPAEASGARGPSTPLQAVLGLSLLLNILAALYFIKKRREA